MLHKPKKKKTGGSQFFVNKMVTEVTACGESENLLPLLVLRFFYRF